MSSSESFVTHAAEQMAGAGSIRTKRMFGEWGFYCDEVFCGVICNDTLFVKPTVEGQAFAPDLDMTPAYDGAKPSLKIDAERLAELVAITRDALGKG